jgi:hypothetical protein
MGKVVIPIDGAGWSMHVVLPARQIDGQEKQHMAIQ